MRRIVFLIAMFSIIVNIRCMGQVAYRGQLLERSNIYFEPHTHSLSGITYIPEIALSKAIGKQHYLKFSGAVDLSENIIFENGQSPTYKFQSNLYRLWARYTYQGMEVRLGLQKINFGSAKVLRPLQWFDDIDPTDPFKFTSGVYGILGKYYFSDNSNIWVWSLIENKTKNQFDILQTDPKKPEYGTRIQYQMHKGEIALTVDRKYTIYKEGGLNQKYGEKRFGIDGKWDLGIGLWLEATSIIQDKNSNMIPNQTLMTIGIDYTFPLGGGLNIAFENLYYSTGKQVINTFKTYNIGSLQTSLPINIASNISSIINHSWENASTSIFLGYEYQFNAITTHFQYFYIPDNGINKEQIIQETTPRYGHGFQFIISYNH